MITNQTQKLVVSVLFAFAAAIVPAGSERYSPEMAEMLMRHYYPEAANTQKSAEPVPETPVAEIVPATPEPTPEIATPAPEPVKPVLPVEPVRVTDADAELTLEEDDLDLTPTEKTWKQTALDKSKAALAKTKAFLSKPGTQAATVALAVCVYTATKAVKSALAKHADKQGTEKLKAMYNSLRTAGLTKVLQGSTQSLSQDSAVKQAFVGIAVDSIVELATKALFGLAKQKTA